MFRNQTRQQLVELAKRQDPKPEVRCADSYDGTIILVFNPSGDISLRTSPRGVTFAGAGGGDFRPKVREALIMLALALEAEPRQERR
jgi:hypothetical protein